VISGGLIAQNQKSISAAYVTTSSAAKGQPNKDFNLDLLPDTF